MLEYVYSDKRIINSLREGPLGKYPDKLAQCYSDMGYIKKHLRHRFGVLSALSKWMISNNRTLNELDNDSINKFKKSRLTTCKNTIRSGSLALLECLLKSLKNDGILPSENGDETNNFFEEILNKYEKYLREERGLSLSTIKISRTVLRNFFTFFPSSDLDTIQNLAPPHLFAYITQCRNQYSSKRTQVICGLLRNFCRYLYLEGLTQNNIAGAVPKIPSRRSPHLPEHLEPWQVTKLLSACDKDTVKGSRNYAILLLLVRMGLRASEVINLTVSNINWREGELKIKGKNAKQNIMPLPYDVGQAIVEYLHKYRQKTNRKQLFLRTKAPYRGLSHPSSISAMVRRTLTSADLKTILKGAHLLRYTTATECLRNGGTLYQACELLRHANIDTTALYAKINDKELSFLVKPWPIANTKEA